MKALLAVHGDSFPHTHHLAELEERLLAYGEKLPELPFDPMLLMPYAVKFRYFGRASIDEITRASIRQSVALLRTHVVSRILQIESS